jgi:hypothetical protein
VLAEITVSRPRNLKSTKGAILDVYTHERFYCNTTLSSSRHFIAISSPFHRHFIAGCQIFTFDAILSIWASTHLARAEAPLTCSGPRVINYPFLSPDITMRRQQMMLPILVLSLYFLGVLSIRTIHDRTEVEKHVDPVEADEIATEKAIEEIKKCHVTTVARGDECCFCVRGCICWADGRKKAAWCPTQESFKTKDSDWKSYTCYKE